MGENEVNSHGPTADDADVSSGLKVTRLIKILAILGILIILILIAVALAVALIDAESWAPLIRIFRDVFLLILLLELLLIVTAFAVLMLQAAGFLIMLKTEVQPILDNARETTRLSKATAQFINSNAVDPLIQIKSFLSGLLAFLRELIRIRALVLSNDSVADQQDEAQTTSS